MESKIMEHSAKAAYLGVRTTFWLAEQALMIGPRSIRSGALPLRRHLGLMAIGNSSSDNSEALYGREWDDFIENGTSEGKQAGMDHKPEATWSRPQLYLMQNHIDG